MDADQDQDHNQRVEEDGPDQDPSHVPNPETEIPDTDMTEIEEEGQGQEIETQEGLAVKADLPKDEAEQESLDHGQEAEIIVATAVFQEIVRRIRKESVQKIVVKSDRHVQRFQRAVILPQLGLNY